MCVLQTAERKRFVAVIMVIVIIAVSRYLLLHNAVLLRSEVI
jgi:PhoPQ-activated pathogenicity-related protein